MVVRHGSISAAARDLRISQPSLSAQIKTFEESLGLALFDRRGHKLQLTPAGKTVYSNAAQMFEISAQLGAYLSRSTKANLPIRLGIADEIERPFAVSLVKHLTTQWKQKEPPSIYFMTGQSDDLLGQLRNWTLDAVITNRPTSLTDLETAGTLIIPIYFAAAGNPKMKKKNAILTPTTEISTDLAKMKRGLCLPSTRLKLREEIDLFLNRDNEPYPIAFESDNLATVVRAIIDDVGVGFAPTAYMAREMSSGEITIYGPRGGLWKHVLFLMTKRQAPTAQYFRNRRGF